MTAANRLELTIERTIPAPPGEVFDAWLDPRIPGTPWNAAERFILDAKVDGLFYWTLKGTSHYGRFTALERPHCIAHTWVSPNTLGEESTVTVTFTQLGDATRMTLVHSGLPDHERARGHERGWRYFVGDVSRAVRRWLAQAVSLGRGSSTCNGVRKTRPCLPRSTDRRPGPAATRRSTACGCTTRSTAPATRSSTSPTRSASPG